MPVGISQVTQICSGGLTSLRVPVGTAHTCCHIRNGKFDTNGVLLMRRARLRPQVAITTQRSHLLYTFETARVT
jgi:hypothetical protein